MDDFWNVSETTPSTLDNFFDEESDVNWTGSTSDHSSVEHVSSTNQEKYLPSPTSGSEIPKHQHRSSLSSGSLSSILDNLSVHSDSGISGIGSNRAKVVGRALGEKIESWKPPSVSIKWKNEGSGSCLHCSTKDEEIYQLKRRLERSYSRHNITLPPEDTVQKIVLGQPYSLESYKMLEDKLRLLDSALGTMDASAILAVLVFMKNSVRWRIFMKELESRPFAAQIYINYLNRRYERTQAIDILSSLGRFEEATMLKYEMAISSPSQLTQAQNLRKFLEGQTGEQASSFEARNAKQHLDLLELQFPIDATDSRDQSNAMLLEYPRSSSLAGKSLLTTLYYCSKYHWQSSDTLPQSPLFLRKQFNISDRQFLWTVIRARANVKLYPLPSDLENLLAAKSFIGTLSTLSGISGGGKVIKNSLSIERVIEALAASGAPSNILSSYASLLGTNEDKLRIGLANNCQLAVVEAYAGLKDRDGLENYMKQMTFGSPEFIKAEQMLKNTKWKK